jgi:CoA:oxalate CoA-transferase
MAHPLPRPLSGIRVIGFEHYIAGPYCTLLLADAGAEVIKIEQPGSGDPRRRIPPFAERDGKKKAAGFMAYNRNKKSLAVDLRHKKGREILRRLAKHTDVVVENLRPGSLEDAGLGYEDLREINPALVYATISGFGRMPGYQSDYTNRPAFDIVAEAMSGVTDLVGSADGPPTTTLYGLPDVYSGMVGAFGIMQALFMRERTGEGQLVDVSLLDNMLALNERMVALYSVTGEEPKRGKPEYFWPRGPFPCADGYVALNVPNDLTWARLAGAMGREDLASDPRFATGPDRAEHSDILGPILESWMAGKTRDNVVEILNRAGMPTGPVYSAKEVFTDEHFKKRGMLPEVDDPEVGAHTFARSVPHLSATPEIPLNPSPALGADTREILEERLGYDAREVEVLAKEGIVGL